MQRIILCHMKFNINRIIKIKIYGRFYEYPELLKEVIESRISYIVQFYFLNNYNKFSVNNLFLIKNKMNCF